MRWASAYKLDMKSSHRLVDVPKPQITGILELQPCIPGRGNHRMRDQYATWLCAFLQPGRDVDVVPEDVMWLPKHVPEILPVRNSSRRPRGVPTFQVRMAS